MSYNSVTLLPEVIVSRPNFPNFNPPARTLLGSGPSITSPRVLRAMAAPSIGHLDPYLLKLYAEEQELLRYVFQAKVVQSDSHLECFCPDFNAFK